MAFTAVLAGQLAQAVQVQQIIDGLQGVAAKGQPIALTALSDASNWALQVRNQDATNQRALQVLAADGTTILAQADGTGVRLAATVGIGAAPVASQALTLGPTTLTGTTQYGILSAPTFGSGTTTLGAAVTGQAQTANASFTLPEASDFLALGGSFGAASTVTNSIGFHAQNQGNARATNAYGVYIDSQSGATTTNLGLFNAGTTQLNDRTGIAIAPGTSVMFRVGGGSTMTGTAQYGLDVAATFTAAITLTSVGIRSGVLTSNSTTVTNLYAFQANVPALGTTNAVTSIAGLRVENQGAGGVTNAYGIHIAAQSGAATDNIGLYNLGSTRLDGVIAQATGLSTAVGAWLNYTFGATSATQYGLYVTPVFSTSATTAGACMSGSVQTSVTGFTMASGYVFWAQVPTIQAAVSITNLYGLNVANQGNARVTNAYGIYINAQSGATTTNIGLYNAGTTTLVGAVTLPSQSVTNANLATDVARLNQLVNGGFEIWQRGNGPFTGTTFTADRWATSLGGTSTMSISRDTVNVDTASGACAAVTYTHNAQSWLSQFLEDTKQLVGRQISVSVRVRTSTASAVRVQLYAGTNAGALIASSPYHTGGGTYETLRVTGTPTAGSPTLISVSISFEASCTAYLDNAMVVYGPNAGDYMPMPPADDLERCLRYYQVLGPNATASLEVSAYAGAGGTPSETFQYSPKAVIPTITKVGTWAVANCSQPTVAGADIDSCYLTITVTALGIGNTWNGNAGNKITVEANP
jgi:hypothetical protein